jgi:prepilin-type N-terminal cleavage/methylation domain-containing protein
MAADGRRAGACSADIFVCCIANCQSAGGVFTGDVSATDRRSSTVTPMQVGNLRNSRLGSLRYLGRSASVGAFTLLELLVVLGIIGLLAAITLPAMKGMRQTNAMASANRQLLDDLGAARQRAIKDGTVVMVLFLPPASTANASAFAPLSAQQKNILLRGQLTHYGMLAERAAGDQPGRRRPRYFTHGGGVWRSLPDGVFIPVWKFPKPLGGGGTNAPVFTALFPIGLSPAGFIPAFDEINGVPIPNIANGIDNILMPYIAFNARGQLVKYDAASGTFKLSNDDAIIPLARGSIFLARNTDLSLAWSEPDVAEKPPGNSVENYNLIVIDKLTGRARIESPQIK